MEEPKKKRTNYARGRDKEYKVLQMARDMGYVGTRSSASHGLWDVTLAGKGETVLVQVKLTSKDKYYEDANCKELRALRVAPGVRKELWVFRTGKKGVEIIDLAKPKPTKENQT